MSMFNFVIDLKSIRLQILISHTEVLHQINTLSGVFYVMFRVLSVVVAHVLVMDPLVVVSQWYGALLIDPVFR